MGAPSWKRVARLRRSRRDPDELETYTLDLLAALMHLCDREDWSFRDMVNEARETRYLHDINGEEHE